MKILDCDVLIVCSGMKVICEVFEVFKGCLKVFIIFFWGFFFDIGLLFFCFGSVLFIKEFYL